MHIGTTEGKEPRFHPRLFHGYIYNPASFARSLGPPRPAPSHATLKHTREYLRRFHESGTSRMDARHSINSTKIHHSGKHPGCGEREVPAFSTPGFYLDAVMFLSLIRSGASPLFISTG